MDTYLLMAYMFSTVPTREIVIAGETDDAGTRGMLDEINNKPAAYVCQNFSCARPTTDVGELKEKLDEDNTLKIQSI